MSRIWTRSGDGLTVTPATQRPTNRVHSAGSSTSTVNRSEIGGPVSTGSVSGKRSGAPVTADTSRASPTRLRTSPRLGLTSTSSTTSPYRSAKGVPTGVSGGRMRMPSASDVSFSSSPEHSMPLLTTPIFSVRSMRRSPGSTAPGKATGTRWPAAMFVAPHTISSGSPPPTVTRVSDSRSARGCRSTASSSPTTTLCQSAPHASMPLTSIPSKVSRSASCSGVSSMSTKSRSHESGTLIGIARGSGGRSRGTGAGR